MIYVLKKPIRSNLFCRTKIHLNDVAKTLTNDDCLVSFKERAEEKTKQRKMNPSGEGGTSFKTKNKKKKFYLYSSTEKKPKNKIPLERNKF